MTKKIHFENIKDQNETFNNYMYQSKTNMKYNGPKVTLCKNKFIRIIHIYIITNNLITQLYLIYF